MPLELPKLNLPDYEFRIVDKSDGAYIFDQFRKKYLKLTPEEWVRQHILSFLIYDRKYPKGLCKIEGGISVNKLKRRCDIVCYNTKQEPVLLVECKAHDINIEQHAFDQAAAYNSTLKAPIMCISNGLVHFVIKIDFKKNKYQFLDEMPDYKQINETF